jgi:hypothetical protein
LVGHPKGDTAHEALVGIASESKLWAKKKHHHHFVGRSWHILNWQSGIDYSGSARHKIT